MTGRWGARNATSPVLFLGLSLMLLWTAKVSGHGRLVEPPSRSSMWRFGFKTKPNYNDNELFCGGFTVQWQRNGGKCGLCGDAWDAPIPRPNEAGGIYGKGIIVRAYKPGQVITATVQITANHRGFFEFKICPHNDPTTEATQECLDRNPIPLADGSGSKYYPSAGTGPFSVSLRLPENLRCSQCVFQWTYTAGNNWGRCSNGSSKLGCGPQETFRGCADVSIDESAANEVPTYEVSKPVNRGPSISAIPPRRPPYKPKTRQRPTKPARRRLPPIKLHRQQPTRKPYYQTRRPIQRRPPVYYNPPRRTTTTTTTTTTRRPFYPKMFGSAYPKRPPPKKQRPVFKTATTKKNYESENVDLHCEAVGAWQNVNGIAKWCESVCARGYCPPSHCKCDTRK